MASRHTGESSARSFVARQAELFAEGFSFSGHERDLVMLNLGERGYLDVSGVSGADSVTDGRGSVFADFDNDGDLDVFVRAMHGPAHLLFRNNVGQDRHWLRILLRGTTSGPDAFGAVVRLRGKQGVRTKLLSGGSGFLGQSDPRLVFGLDRQEQVESIEVTWPAGRKENFGGARAGETLVLTEGSGHAQRVTAKEARLPDPLSAQARIWRTLTFEPGMTLPAVSLRSGDASVELSEQLASGRPALLNFWSTTCVPCRAEMPELEKLHRSGGGEGLQIIGISLDEPGREKAVASVIAKLEVTYPIFGLDPAARSSLFTTNDIQIPLSLYLDEQHQVREVFRGWSPEVHHRIKSLADR